MTDKPARCPNPSCGSDMIGVSYNSELEALKVTCRVCDAASGWHKTTGDALEAWNRMGEWRNGGWRDIETAPKDGSTIIAACYGDKTSGSYYWESEPNHWGETGWQEEDARGGPKLWRHPSKLDVWRPLPEPPKEEP